jgi:uncharacterized metal-binding protein
MNDTAEVATKVGIISCSGEEIPGGTLSRLATLRVLTRLRPNAGVTLCLPLFLAGDPGLRNFARAHPTITVDGCEKQCARWATEEYSGPVSRALVVSQILGDQVTGCRRSSRSSQVEDGEAVRALADVLATALDEVLQEHLGAASETKH